MSVNKFMKKAEKVYEGFEDQEEPKCELCGQEIPDDSGVVADYCQADFCSKWCLDRCRAENEDNPDCRQCLEYDPDEDEEVTCPECGADITDLLKELLEEDED